MIGEGAVIEDNAVITNNDEISVVSEYEVVKPELALQGGR